MNEAATETERVALSYIERLAFEHAFAHMQASERARNDLILKILAVHGMGEDDLHRMTAYDPDRGEFVLSVVSVG